MVVQDYLDPDCFLNGIRCQSIIDRIIIQVAFEPVIGIIKEVLGFRQFSLRGLTAAADEWCLVCLAFNLKRLHTLWIAC